MQQYAKNACVCIKNRHNAYTEGNGAYAYARVGTSIYIAAVCIKKLLSRQVYATKEEYAYVCTCIEPYATGHKSHAIRAQTALISCLRRTGGTEYSQTIKEKCSQATNAEGPSN